MSSPISGNKTKFDIRPDTGASYISLPFFKIGGSAAATILQIWAACQKIMFADVNINEKETTRERGDDFFPGTGSLVVYKDKLAIVHI